MWIFKEFAYWLSYETLGIINSADKIVIGHTASLKSHPQRIYVM